MGKATVDGKKPKAAKKMKDPNAPKRAMSAFFIWMNENRDRIKKPGMSVGDVAKAAGIEWAAMTDKSVSFSLSVRYDRMRHNESVLVRMPLLE
uniref:HMG box domain-containing protein n=1 Tax=Setaria digitata TaxID=48799 RepID=A0A915PSX6_9BILA